MRTNHALLGLLLSLQLTAGGLRAADGTTSPVPPTAPDDSVKAQNTVDEAHTDEKHPGFFEQDFLTGGWGGARTKLADKGVVYSVNSINEVFGNPSGGLQQGVVSDGRIELALDLDFKKLAGLDGGSFHANAYYIYGSDLSAGKIGNIMTISNIEAYDTLRLFDLWYQQNFFNDKVSIRFGQIAADDEFIISDYAATFINGTFGWPTLTAANLPSGGPGYPLATPGIRLQINPIDQISFLAAIFDGDPGDGAANGQKRDSTGTNVDLNQGSLSMFELQYHLNQEKDAKGLPGNYKLGGYFLSNPTPGVGTAGSNTYPSNYGVYFVADQMVWRKPTLSVRDPKDMKNVASSDEPNDQGLGLFWRIGGTPSNRNLVDFYTDGGLNYKGLIPGRESDVLGLGVAYASISNDINATGSVVPGGPIPNDEIAIELTYQAQIAPWWVVQPDVQYIINPGGNQNVMPGGTAAVSNAVVLGVRSTINF